MRSGRSVIFMEGDVTILGSVGSGAEIVAGGSIHVYGALRGRALAGAAGNGRARIFCHRVEAELLAINSYYKTADEIDDAVRSQPGQAWLEGETLQISTMNSGQRKVGHMAQVLVVTSGKGGVGRTVRRRLPWCALAHDGAKVVVIDFDVGLRNLDLVLGAERRDHLI